MNQAPLFRVQIGPRKRDITHLIEKLKFEHTTEKDNSLEITIKRDHAQATADDEDIVANAIVTYQYGFSHGQMSPVQAIPISDIDVMYRDRVTMIVRCLDEGNGMKKNGPQIIWTGKNAAAIAREIAKVHGLKADVVDGKDLRKITEEAQGGRSDFEFLQYLAAQEAGYIFFVDSKGLHFKKRGTTNVSSIQYRYGDGRLQEFCPKFRKSGQSPTSQEAPVTTVDPMTKQEIVVSDSTGTKLGKNRYDLNANYVGRSEQAPGKNVVTPPKDPQAAGAASNALTSLSNLNVLEADFKVWGNPLLFADMVITVGNVAKKYAGNWYVKRVVQEISTSGFITSGTVAKDGTLAPIVPGSGTNPDVNKTDGPKEQEHKKTVKRYNENSEPYTGSGSGGSF